MGFIDRLADALDDATGGPDKVPGGFDPNVCQGCPERGDGPFRRCDLCGCPTVSKEDFGPTATLDTTQRTPEGCPRETEHKERG